MSFLIKMFVTNKTYNLAEILSDVKFCSDLGFKVRYHESSKELLLVRVTEEIAYKIIELATLTLEIPRNCLVFNEETESLRVIKTDINLSKMVLYILSVNRAIYKKEQELIKSEIPQYKPNLGLL